MKRMNYEDLKQTDMRNQGILCELEKANERGEKCKYSEEQIVEAQKGEARKKSMSYIAIKLDR